MIFIFHLFQDLSVCMLMFYILIFQELIAIDIAYFNFLIGLVNLFKLSLCL